MIYKKILITGGAGFIGTNLTEFIINKYPKSKIVIFDNFSNHYKGFKKKFIGKKKIRIVNANLINKTKLLKETLDVDLVFHLAANSDISLAINNPLIDFNGTIITSNLLECCRINKVKKIIYTSGSGIYGDNKRTQTESNVRNIIPVSFYGASKLACEALLSAYSHMYNMNITVLRMANVIGKYSTHGVIYDFLLKLKKNKSKLIILGNGKQNKSYLHVSDLLKAFFLILKKQKKKYEVFNLSTNELVTVDNISKTIFKILKIRPKVIYTGGNIGWKGDVSYIKMSNTKLKKIGWNYSYKSKIAVKKTINENLSIYKKTKLY
jgi:UDP-glucose 4-epimerase